MHKRIIPISLALAVLMACHGPGSDSDSEESVVARFGELEVTVADVDSWVLALPPASRPAPGRDLEAWFEEQIREIVIERALRSEAEADLVNDEIFLAARREAEKQAAIQLCLADRWARLDEVTEEELHEVYESRADTFAAPEQRSVFHIFRRVAPGASREAVLEEMKALRDRVLGGESFHRLAAEHSDSESRHRDGSLGWVRKGQLPAGFEEVIFSLDEGVPSEPVATHDGFHIFYVDQVLRARRLDYDEARPALRDRLVAEHREAALEEFESEIEPPAGTFCLDRDDLAAAAETGDPEAVVLRVGGTELTLADFRRQLRQSVARQPSGGGASIDAAWQYLQHLRRRELIYDHCLSGDLVPAGELETRLDAWQEKALPAIQRQRRMVEIAQRDDARLRLFYEGNVGLFSQPPKWHLQRLQVPLGDDPRTAQAAMARLEAAASGTGTTLEELASELGGEIEDLGLRTAAELRNLEPKLPPLVAPLGVGELSAPYRTESTLEIARVLHLQAAEPLPFEEVRERVAAAYVHQYTREVYQELSNDILGTAELEILPEGLAALRDAGLPQPEISVEQLEELLNEL